jgi:hypothetical protein
MKRMVIFIGLVAVTLLPACDSKWRPREANAT